MNYRPFTLLDALRGIQRRKAMVASLFVAIVSLVGLITVLSPKSYTSDAKMFLRLGRENAAMDATATLGEQPVVMMPHSREAEINSVVEILQSKQLYEEVVDKIGAERILKRNWKPAGTADSSSEPGILSSTLDATLGWLTSIGVLNDLPARERAVIALRKKTDIGAFEKSNVITVTVESHTPDLAQAIVASLIETYTNQHLRLHRSPGAYEFLSSETDRIHQLLLNKQKELEQFKNESGILASDQHRAVLIERLARLEGDLLLAESEENALMKEVQMLEDSLENLPDRETTAMTIGAGNDGVDAMRQELFKLEVLREELASRYNEGHPRRQQVDQQIDVAKEIFSDVEAKRTESIEGPSKVHQETLVNLLQRKPALAAATARREKLTEQIARFEKELEQFTRSEYEFAQLDREVALLDANYRKYANNLEQAKIDDSMESQRFSNIGLAQPAALNLKPYRPSKLINLLAGIVLGLCGSCGMAVMLEYLQTAHTSPFPSKSFQTPHVRLTVPPMPDSQSQVRYPRRTAKRHKEPSSTAQM